VYGLMVINGHKGRKVLICSVPKMRPLDYRLSSSVIRHYSSHIFQDFALSHTGTASIDLALYF
jgi:hypothetical protein